MLLPMVTLIAGAIINRLRSLVLKLVAEAVETPEQQDVLANPATARFSRDAIFR